MVQVSGVPMAAGTLARCRFNFEIGVIIRPSSKFTVEGLSDITPLGSELRALTTLRLVRAGGCYALQPEQISSHNLVRLAKSSRWYTHASSSSGMHEAV